MRLYDTNGTWLRDIAVTDPGALAFDRNGNILVAQEAEGTVLQVSQTGTILHTLTLPTGEAPHALYFDPTTQYLWIGDAGPDQNAKIYDTRDACLADCATHGTDAKYTSGDPGRTDMGNEVACQLYHGVQASLAPGEHCLGDLAITALTCRP